MCERGRDLLREEPHGGEREPPELVVFQQLVEVHREQLEDETDVRMVREVPEQVHDVRAFSLRKKSREKSREQSTQSLE